MNNGTGNNWCHCSLQFMEFDRLSLKVMEFKDLRFVCLMKGGNKMLPIIDKKKTGINLRLMMDERGFTVKDIQHYLKLGSVQSIYHWLNGISLPTVDNLYALSYLFQVPVDDILCGTRPGIITSENQAKLRRLWVYYKKINKIQAA